MCAGTPLSMDELKHRVSEKFAAGGRVPPSREAIQEDLDFLVNVGAVVCGSDGRASLTPSGEELAKGVLPQSTHVR